MFYAPQVATSTPLDTTYALSDDHVAFRDTIHTPFSSGMTPTATVSLSVAHGDGGTGQPTVGGELAFVRECERLREHEQGGCQLFPELLRELCGGGFQDPAENAFHNSIPSNLRINLAVQAGPGMFLTRIAA